MAAPLWIKIFSLTVYAAVMIGAAFSLKWFAHSIPQELMLVLAVLALGVGIGFLLGVRHGRLNP
jgi:hypothetical protein